MSRGTREPWHSASPPFTYIQLDGNTCTNCPNPNATHTNAQLHEEDTPQPTNGNIMLQIGVVVPVGEVLPRVVGIFVV
jgi:hypothetical protein